jgi:hypothetical protein
VKSKIRLMWVVVLTLLFAVPAALASTAWYVNVVSGSDSNNCKSSTTGFGRVFSFSHLERPSEIRAFPQTVTLRALVGTLRHGGAS